MPAEKTSGSSRHTREGNAEFDAVLDQHNVNVKPKVLLSIKTLFSLFYKNEKVIKTFYVFYY